MSRITCAHEPETLRAIAQGRWPDGADPEMQAHVAECAICVDLVEIAVLLSRDRETTVRNARLPGSGAVWWRAQARIRQERLRASQRTVTLVQAAMLGAGLIVALAVINAMPMVPHGWLGSLSRLRDGIDIAAITRMIRANTPLMLTILAMLAVLPVATHFALTED